MREVVLAMLAKEPSHGCELRARLRDALGPVGEAMNAGQIIFTPDGDVREATEPVWDRAVAAKLSTCVDSGRST